MKKIFTLAVLALLSAVSANAQSTLRKTWDFRQGFSAKTVNALMADQEEFGADKYWRNYESDATKADQQHFWCASKDAKNAQGYACTHNGGQEKTISELEGLTLGFSAAKKFVITYDGAQAPDETGNAPGGMVPYGKSYIWLNGKNETIKFNAEVGQTIRIAVESHAVNKSKLGEARGISLSASNGTLAPKFDGNPVPTYYTEYEWDLAGETGAVAELTIKSTNGCHIYYIIVGEGDDPNANKTQVSYITAGDATSESAYQALAADEQFVVTALDAASVTADILKNNKVTVISPLLPADNSAVAVVKEAMPFTPIVNLNADLYAAWGYGQVATGYAGGYIKNIKHSVFNGFVEGEDYQIVDERPAFFFSEGEYKAVRPNEYFASDDTLIVDASDETIAALHIHNEYHNAYIYMPYLANGATAATNKLLVNVVNAAVGSKSEITKTATPKIILEYKDMKTNIAMAMASSNLSKPHIYYTLDGSDPTIESAEYTEPLTVTQETVVKAVAIAEGYLLSDAAQVTAEIFAQPAAPTFAKVFNESETAVSLACSTEDADIWYNYSESNDTAKSMKYTEPLSIKIPVTLTAFAVVNGQVFSELTTERIVVKNAIVRQDQISAFDANAADWQNGGGSTVYYFSWGKNARGIYDTTAEPIGQDPETGDNIYPEYPYEYYAPITTDANGNTIVKGDWEIKSKGQVMIWQSLTTGADPGNAGGYNPETAGDILSYAKITSNDIQFGGKIGELYTGAIQSVKKFQAPFDIITIIGTAAGGENVGRMQLQVSTDSTAWTNVGEEMTTSTVKRLWKTYTRSYNGTDEVYVRLIQAGGGSSVQIYNIYIMNAGELSQALKAQYDEEYATGISTISNMGTNATKGIYNINGIRQNGLRRGLNIIVSEDGSVKKVMIK